MRTKWKRVFDWPYEVGDDGSVRRINGDYLKPACDGRGYLRVTLSNGPLRFNCAVHSLVLLIFIGPRPRGLQAAHGDGNKSNNRLSNLRWATPRENSQDKIRHGTQDRGEEINTSVLTSSQAMEILASPRSARRLAPLYGVSHATICRLRSGATWTHLVRPTQPKRRRSGQYTDDDVARGLA